jgi:hypothetical protein
MGAATLQGFVHGVAPMLHNKLAGSADMLAAMVAKVGLRASEYVLAGQPGFWECARQSIEWDLP